MKWIDRTLLDQLEIGISIITWHPEDPPRAEWVFVNDALCRMSGYTRDEMLCQSPYNRATRESKAQIEAINIQIATYGSFMCETMQPHRSYSAFPVIMYYKLIKLGGDEVLMIEHHDIRSFKETELLLKQAQQNTQEMLTLIDAEKKQLSENFAGNLGLVLFPLIEQLRITATGGQKDILDLMVGRLKHVARDVGIAKRSDAFGSNLTRRQILICEMIRDGMSSKDIARAFDCAPSTINNHRNVIRRKLNRTGKSTNLQAFLNGTNGSGS